MADDDGFVRSKSRRKFDDNDIEDIVVRNSNSGSPNVPRHRYTDDEPPEPLQRMPSMRAPPSPLRLSKESVHIPGHGGGDAAITIPGGEDGAHIAGQEGEQDVLLSKSDGDNGAATMDDRLVPSEFVTIIPYSVRVLQRLRTQTAIQSVVGVIDPNDGNHLLSSAALVATQLDADIKEAETLITNLTNGIDGTKTVPGVFHPRCGAEYSPHDVLEGLREVHAKLETAQHMLHLRLKQKLPLDALLVGVDGQNAPPTSKSWEYQQDIVGQRLVHEIASTVMSGGDMEPKHPQEATQAGEKENAPPPPAKVDPFSSLGALVTELKSRDAKYFCEGVVQCHPYRLKPNLVGPIRTEKEKPIQLVTTIPLPVKKAEQFYQAQHDKQNYQVDIHVSSVRFDTHEMFSEEDALVAELIRLNEVWMKYDADEGEEHRNYRSYRRLIRQKVHTSNAEEILELQHFMEASSAYEVQLLQRMQTLWENILEVRKREGLNRTGVLMGFVRRKTLRSQQQRRMSMSQRRASSTLQGTTLTSDSDTGGEGGGQQPPAPGTTEPQIQQFVPKVTVPPDYEPENLDKYPDEVQRRNAVNAQRYFVSISIQSKYPMPSNRFVTRTNSAPLLNNFKVSFDTSIRIELQTPMEEVHFHVYRERPGQMFPTEEDLVASAVMMAFGKRPTSVTVRGPHHVVSLTVSVVCSEAINRVRQQYFVLPNTFEMVDVDTLRSKILSGELDVCNPANSRLLYKLATWYGRQHDKNKPAQEKRGLKFSRYLSKENPIPTMNARTFGRRDREDGTVDRLDGSSLVTVEEISNWKEARTLRWKNSIEKRRQVILGEKEDDYVLLARIMPVPKIPQRGQFFTLLQAFFQPVRQLNPYRKPKPKKEEINVTGLTEGKESSEIVVHILKAQNIPIRHVDHMVSGNTPPSTDLNVFVEVSFIGNTVRSRAETGNHPTWYQSIRLPFKAPGYTDQYLEVIQDEICISLYDEVHIPLEGSAQSDVIHYRVEHRYLGHVVIPFPSLYQSETASIEGTFLVDTPTTTLSYRHVADDNYTTTLDMYVSLWPPLHKENKTLNPILNVQIEPYCLVAKHYDTECKLAIDRVVVTNPVAAERRVGSLVQNKSGNWMLIQRYINPNGIVPPPCVTTPNEAVHFTRCVPFTSDAIQFEGGGVLRDVWCTASELFQMDGGDYEEHALLLANFFLYFKMEYVHVVQGRTNAYPEVSFVLTMDSVSRSLFLWDPCSGGKWDVRDPSCPLRSVGIVFSKFNVWFNIQNSGAPANMLWDFAVEANWKPLLRPGDAPPPTLQPAIVKSATPSLEFLSDIEFRLLTTIKNVLDVQCKARTSKWNYVPNRQIGAALRQVLMEYEIESKANLVVSSAKAVEIHRRHLSTVLGDFHVEGHPIHMPLSAESHFRIVDVVLETKVFDTSPDAQFAIAVYAAPMVHKIVSVWVYVASAIPRHKMK